MRRRGGGGGGGWCRFLARYEKRGGGGGVLSASGLIRKVGGGGGGVRGYDRVSGGPGYSAIVQFMRVSISNASYYKMRPVWKDLWPRGVLKHPEPPPLDTPLRCK